MARDNNYTYTGVLTSEENKQKNYLIVNKTKKGEIIITPLTLCIMATTFVILLIAAIVATYFVTAQMMLVEQNQNNNNSNSNLAQNLINNGQDISSSNNNVLASGFINYPPVSSKDNGNSHTPSPSSITIKENNELNKLPTHLKPSHYTIQLQPFINENNFTTDGNVSIQFQCNENANNITLNIKDIIVDEYSVKVCSYNTKIDPCTEIPIQEHLYNAQYQQYIIVLQKKLMAGKNYSVTIHFQSNINDYMQGFYRSSYTLPQSNEKHWLASTQFSPIDARRAFPSFDEPNYKSTFKVSIARDSRMHKAISNMPIQSTQPIPNSNGWVWDSFFETPLMSTYLVAFTVSDLSRAENVETLSQINTSYWTEFNNINKTAYSSEIVPKLLTYLEQYFDIKFPLPKIDFVAVPDFGYSAMENWGLITCRESILLYDPFVSTAEAKQKGAVTLSHEIGHQWFGNLVTPAWWNDVWLKEGFATWLGYVALNNVETDWKLLDQFVVDELSFAFDIDSINSTRPISRTVNTPDEIRQVFNPISYEKAASVIRMMNYFLGENGLKTGLRKYLQQYQYSNAKQDDLWLVLNEFGTSDAMLPKDVTVKNIMDTWTLYSGYPLVTVIRNYESGKAELSQKRFLNTNQNISIPKEQTGNWFIPITYATADEPEFNNLKTKVWLTDTTVSIEALPQNGWVIVNLNNVGYYRVNYDANNWKLLTEHYLEFPEVIRSQIISDALNIARINELNYTIALDLLKQISKDTRGYLSWKLSIKEINYLYHMLIRTPAYSNLKVFILNIVDATFKQFDINGNQNSSHLTKLHQQQILNLACQMQNEVCTNQAQYIFRNWMIYYPDPRSFVKPDLKQLVYCTAVREGNDREWDFLYDRYLEEPSATDATVILNALGCASEEWLLARYLSRLLQPDGPIKKSEGATVFTAVANNPYGYRLAFDFLRNNWNEIITFYGDGFNIVSHMVESIGVFSNTPAQLEEIINFKNKNSNNLHTTEQAFVNLINTVSANIEWLKNSYPTIEFWLDTFRIYF